MQRRAVAKATSNITKEQIVAAYQKAEKKKQTTRNRRPSRNQKRKKRLNFGIPVTHREYGISFAIVSAHDKSKEGKPVFDWKGLVSSVDTIAFYIGVSNISYIAENLILHGKPEETPVILIQWGTFGRQKTLKGTLGDIAEKVKETRMLNPAIPLVGDIVSLRDKLKWFENKPLYGRQILIARTGTAQSPLAAHLKEQGADVIEFPKWKKKEVPINEKILNQLFTYEGILFTSPECTNEFFDLLINRNIDIKNVRAELFHMSNKSLKVLKEWGFIESGGYYGIEAGDLLKKLTVVCMGNNSDQRIKASGYRSDSILPEPNVSELTKVFIRGKRLEGMVSI
ncbi:hypothetical protein [Sporosarcina globispora]|uniref:hypothetical protein n=1 Tax=Sporosarcina globispora TaxID=1459 RepID=UPI00128F027B|nr:hypothetical protein [Sporosarcina globispora]